MRKHSFSGKGGSVALTDRVGVGPDRYRTHSIAHLRDPASTHEPSDPDFESVLKRLKKGLYAGRDDRQLRLRHTFRQIPPRNSHQKEQKNISFPLLRYHRGFGLAGVFVAGEFDPPCNKPTT